MCVGKEVLFIPTENAVKKKKKTERIKSVLYLPSLTFTHCCRMRFLTVGQLASRHCRDICT